MKKDIVIYCAGGFGRHVAWLIEQINQVNPEWNLLGYLDDYHSNKNKIINGYPVLGDQGWLNNYKKRIYITCASGSPLFKKEIITRIKNYHNVHFATLIHPSVIMSSYIKIGQGVIICAGSIITTNIIIGDYVTINLSCTIGHDSIIKDFCTLHPNVNVSGNVIIGECTLISTGCKLVNNLKIGRNISVAAGSVVVRDLPDDCTAAGYPDRPVKTNKQHKV